MEDQRIHPTTNTGENYQNPSPSASPIHPLFRYHTPENAIRDEALTRRRNRGRTCSICCCILLFLTILAGISAGALYLVFRFRVPNYSIKNLTTTGLNLTSSGPVQLGFELTVRANNPNRKVGIYYLEDSEIRVLYEGLELSRGVFPVFYQPTRNVTVVQMVLNGSDIVLDGAIRTGLLDAESRGGVPLTLKIKAPVKIRVGYVDTWKITVRVRCNVVIDGLDQNGRLISNHCVLE